MKKVFTAIVGLACVVCFAANSNANVPGAGNSSAGNFLAQDTNPKPKKDSRWEKKKKQDSTRLPKTDTLRMHQ